MALILKTSQAETLLTLVDKETNREALMQIGLDYVHKHDDVPEDVRRNIGALMVLVEALST